MLNAYSRYSFESSCEWVPVSEISEWQMSLHISVATSYSISIPVCGSIMCRFNVTLATGLSALGERLAPEGHFTAGCRP